MHFPNGENENICVFKKSGSVSNGLQMIFFIADRSTKPSEPSGKIQRLLLVKSSTAQTPSPQEQRNTLAAGEQSSCTGLHRSSLPALWNFSGTAEERGLVLLMACDDGM